MGETVKGGLDVLKTRIEELECELDRVTKKYARLIQLINLCPHAFYAIDYDGRFLFVNRIAGKFLGAAPKDIVGRSYAEVRGAAEAARIIKLGRSIIDSGEPHITSEQRMVDAGGTERVLQFHDIPYFDEEYGVRAVLGVGTDMTDRAQKETLALRNKRIEHELDVAQGIQRGLLPSASPISDSFEIAGWNQAAAKTGGDFFDWVELPDGRIMVAIADVTGHGIGPALIAAVCRAYFRMSQTIDHSVQDIVRRVNKLLVSDLHAGRFVTAVVGLLDPGTKVIELHSAGHGPVWHYRASDRSVLLDRADGVPLGITTQNKPVQSRRIGFDSGDMLLLITDGFFEWSRADGERFGLERLTEVIAKWSALPPARLIEKLRDEITAFVDGTEQRDDLTAVVIRCR